MSATTEEAKETILIQKTKDLCQTILEQPEFRQMRQRVETFLADDAAQQQYQIVVTKGDALQQKQQFGLPIDNTEILEFEQNRDLLLSNSVAREFLDAQQQMHQIQESVMQYVTKTLELGRVPTGEDLGGCGSRCSCGH